MRLIYVPLEEMPGRYTKMMNDLIKPHSTFFVYPKDWNDSGIIDNGEFLDINKTVIFKSKQLEMIARLFYDGWIRNGDVFLFADIFFPGIESVKYMAELQDIDIKVYAYNHAGRSDKTDFVQKLGRWADTSELGWHMACDGIFVGSNYQRKNIYNHFEDVVEKVYKTGMPWSTEYLEGIAPICHKKESYVIWPHRCSKEKGIKELIVYAKMNPRQHIIITSGNPRKNIKLPQNVEYLDNLLKEEYYDIFSRAKYYLSTARQETFGYTLQEAIYFGCKIAVPKRACYPEMVPEKCLYSFIEEIKYYKVDMKWTQRFNFNVINTINFIKNENSYSGE